VAAVFAARGSIVRGSGIWDRIVTALAPGRGREHTKQFM